MKEECSRRTLLSFINLYIEALVARDPGGLPVSADLRATENGNELKLGEGIWETARCMSYRKTIVDPQANQAGLFGVVVEKGDGKALFVLRLKIHQQQITEIETLVAREGCHPLFSPDSLDLKPIWDMTIPETERLPRDRLIAIADSYFEGIEQNDVSIIPFHPDCNRRENGIQTTNNPPILPLSAPTGISHLSYIKKVRGRRYPVVDENRGLVLGIVQFDVPGRQSETIQSAEDSQENAFRTRPRTLLLYEIFKIEDGLIRDIEAFMSNAPLGASLGWS